MRNLSIYSVLAALAPEISRQPLAVRKRINQAMLAYRERMIPYIPGASLEEKRARFPILIPRWRECWPPSARLPTQRKKSGG